MTTDLIGLDDLVSREGDYLDPSHFFAAWGSGTARYWRRRAEIFLAARPRPDENHCGATPERLREQWVRLTEMAEACQHRAEIAERYGPSPADRALIVDVASALVVAG